MTTTQTAMIPSDRISPALSAPSAPRGGRVRRVALLTAAMAGCLMLNACGLGDWLGIDDEPKEKLAGKRISVLQLSQQLEPDTQLLSRPVTLPTAVTNSNFAQPGGSSDHNIGHLALPSSLEEAWSASVEGTSGGARLLSPPVISNGRIYVLGTDFALTSFDEQTGKKVWEADMTRPDTDNTAMGGGVSVGEGFVFVTTGYGEVIKVDPKDGSIVWRQRIAAPIRTPATIAAGRVFVLTADNQCIVLAADNRVLQWTQQGFPEPAALLGGASVAVSRDIAIVPYTSGELYALRIDNGHPAWNDNLASAKRSGNLANLSDIHGEPVIDHGVVYAVSYSGRTVAIDERTGQHVWEQDVGGSSAPAVVGDWVFIVNDQAQVVALARDSGRIRWIKQLERYQDVKKQKDAIYWIGPVVAGGRLIVANSVGKMVDLSPVDGAEISTIDVGGPISIPPVVANNSLYVLTDDGDLYAYRAKESTR